MINNTTSIDEDEVMQAYGIVQILKEEIIRMEEEAYKHYKLADELFKQEQISKSNLERIIGNTIMERVITLKQIMMA